MKKAHLQLYPLTLILSATGYAAVLAGSGVLETELVQRQLRSPSGLHQSVGSVEQSGGE
jgi:hypothetical protein